MKQKNKTAFNILNLLHLEKNIKKQKNILFPMGKLKSSITSYTLFLNKRQKNLTKNLPPNNLNKKNTISYNKTKNLNSIKSIDLIQSNKITNEKN